MEKSYLIQRLRKPQQFAARCFSTGVDNPFAFGGGYKNGGLGEEAMQLIRPLFSFDYMGSAEFEFGAVPEALSAMCEAKLAYGQVHTGIGTGIVYYICPEQWTKVVVDRICKFASSPHHDTKERVGLHDALTDTGTSWTKGTIGWLELDNGFMFFIDKTMFDGVCKMFALIDSEVAK